MCFNNPHGVAQSTCIATRDCKSASSPHAKSNKPVSTSHPHLSSHQLVCSLQQCRPTYSITVLRDTVRGKARARSVPRSLTQPASSRRPPSPKQTHQHLFRSRLGELSFRESYTQPPRWIDDTSVILIASSALHALLPLYNHCRILLLRLWMMKTLHWTPTNPQIIVLQALPQVSP